MEFTIEGLLEHYWFHDDGPGQALKVRTTKTLICHSQGHRGGEWLPWVAPPFLRIKNQVTSTQHGKEDELSIENL